jgi:hypothetical protein
MPAVEKQKRVGFVYKIHGGAAADVGAEIVTRRGGTLIGSVIDPKHSLVGVDLGPFEGVE